MCATCVAGDDGCGEAEQQRVVSRRYGRLRLHAVVRVGFRVRDRVTCGDPMMGRNAAKRRAVRRSAASSYLVRVRVRVRGRVRVGLGLGVGLNLGVGVGLGLG